MVAIEKKRYSILVSIVPSRPGKKPEIDDETRHIIERRLATADSEPREDSKKAIEEIRRKINQPIPR